MPTDRSTRRWRLAAVAAVAALLLAACAPAASPAPGGGTPAPGESPGDGDGAAAGPVVMLSTQLGPEEEQASMRDAILAGSPVEVEFIASAEAGAIVQQIQAQGEAGEGEASLIGALHGEFSTFAADGYLSDLSDVAEELADLGINEQFMELGRLGGDQQLYIPWMQATYIMAARAEALDFLPDGADVNDLTWEQITEWGANIQAETGNRALGFPAGPDGLWHRFFQGYGYPAFTGGVNTTFAGDSAVDFWSWLTETWQYVNPQATTYNEMSTPLQSGEVWVAWDHTARLITALTDQPDDIVAFPVPAGPEGTAFMPVVAGLGVPTWAPNAEGAKDAIVHLLQPETQATTLSEVAFFPVIEAELPGELEPGIAAEQEAVAAMTGRDDALPSLLPVGLGDQGNPYNQVFRDTFQAIVLDGGDPAEVLASQAANLQAVLDAAGAACWAPDPPSEGTCQVEQ
jgi:multiple sugar transport system substrate-binding protein